jgi:hypothetical protein
MKHLFILITTSLLLSACAELQDSSNKVLTNAGSVVRTGQDKMWVKDEENKNKENKK